MPHIYDTIPPPNGENSTQTSKISCFPRQQQASVRLALHVDTCGVQIMPVLLPDLLALVKQPGAYEVSVQRRAVAIMRAVVACSINAVGPYKIQARTSLLPHLEPWLQQFCDILSRPLKPGVSPPHFPKFSAFISASVILLLLLLECISLSLKTLDAVVSLCSLE